MLRTIEISSCVFVQGEFAGQLGDGRAMVRDGDKLYCGRLVDDRQRPAPVLELFNRWRNSLRLQWCF